MALNSVSNAVQDVSSLAICKISHIPTDLNWQNNFLTPILVLLEYQLGSAWHDQETSIFRLIYKDYIYTTHPWKVDVHAHLPANQLLYELVLDWVANYIPHPVASCKMIQYIKAKPSTGSFLTQYRRWILMSNQPAECAAEYHYDELSLILSAIEDQCLSVRVSLYKMIICAYNQLLQFTHISWATLTL